MTRTKQPQTAGGWALHHGSTPPANGKRRPAPHGARHRVGAAHAKVDRVDQPITIAMIGGYRLLRDATASLLASEEGLQIFGAFDSAAQYARIGTDRAPNILLVDCDGDEWHDAVETLSTPHLESRVVLLCEMVRAQIIRCAIEQRVNGVILKSYTPRETREAIAYVATGRTVMPLGWQRVLDGEAAKPLGLSPRHRQILALIAQGRGNEEIAAELELSLNTVKFHIRVLYSRLGVHNRVEAANRYAVMGYDSD